MPCRLSRTVPYAAIAILVVQVLWGSPVFGLVLYDQDYPADTDCIPKPIDAVASAFIHSGGTKRTSTVIAPNYIITAGHWSMQAGLAVEIPGDATSYKVAAYRKESGTVPFPDLCVCRVEKTAGGDASLSNWVDLYLVHDEMNREVTYSSYGPQQSTHGTRYVLHWGRNVWTYSLALMTRIHGHRGCPPSQGTM